MAKNSAGHLLSLRTGGGAHPQQSAKTNDESATPSTGDSSDRQQNLPGVASAPQTQPQPAQAQLNNVDSNSNRMVAEAPLLVGVKSDLRGKEMTIDEMKEYIALPADQHSQSLRDAA